MKQYKLENAPIVYYISGTKHSEWVLFLHAAFVNHTMFETQVAYFREKYNILTLDLIGHGNSTDIRMGDGIEKMSDWIFEILKNENIPKAHIVGISLGAVLAQDFANRFPEKVQSLACFGGYDINRFDTKLQKENRTAQTRMMLKAIFSVKWFAKSNQKISAHTKQAQEDFYKMNIRFPKKSFSVLATLGNLINAHPPTKRSYPLLIGCGQYDISAEHTAVKMWKKNEPNCQTVIFQGAGHCVNMDVPQQFNQTLESFWTGENQKRDL